MRRIIIGQILLIIGLLFYLIWWYRSFRPGTNVNRVKGINGLLLLVTAAFCIGGIAGTLTVDIPAPLVVPPFTILTIGIIAYILLLLLTRFCFHRIVTSELMLIVVWTMLEVWAIDVLNAGGALSSTRFAVMGAVIAVAFIVSMVLYVAYYRMEEMKAFYAAMVPLVIGEVTMITLVVMTI